MSRYRTPWIKIEEGERENKAHKLAHLSSMDQSENEEARTGGGQNEMCRGWVGQSGRGACRRRAWGRNRESLCVS